MTKEQAEQFSSAELLRACMAGDEIARAELQERQERLKALDELLPVFNAKHN